MKAEKDIFVIERLTTGYNGRPVLHGLNLTLRKGEICCVIGEEGSGKSTLLKAVTQQLKSVGKIAYNGVELNNVPTSQMTKRRIDFIAQGGNILKSFTVEEHILLALSERNDEEKSLFWKELDHIFPKLIRLRKQVAGRLSGGGTDDLIYCLLDGYGR